MENISITYHTEAGEITGSLTASPDTIEPNKVGLWVYGSGDMETQYILSGEITPRPTQLTTLTDLTLTNLPTPCQIIIDGTSYDGVDSPTVDLEFDESGTHNIKVVAFPYLDKEFSVET
jgi:hypothetical protein